MQEKGLTDKGTPQGDMEGALTKKRKLTLGNPGGTHIEDKARKDSCPIKMLGNSRQSRNACRTETTGKGHCTLGGKERQNKRQVKFWKIKAAGQWAKRRMETVSEDNEVGQGDDGPRRNLGLEQGT